MKRIIDGEWKTPWCIGKEVKRIKGMKDHFNVIFQHVLQEGNTLANYFANLVFSFAGTIIFNSFTEVPSTGRRILNLDKSKTPNLRVRITKGNAPD